MVWWCQWWCLGRACVSSSFLGEICPGTLSPSRLVYLRPRVGVGSNCHLLRNHHLSPLLTVRGTKRPVVMGPFVCLTPEQQVRPSKSASRCCVLSLVQNRRDCLRATGTRPIVDELVGFLPDLPSCCSPAAYRIRYRPIQSASRTFPRRRYEYGRGYLH